MPGLAGQSAALWVVVPAVFRWTCLISAQDTLLTVTVGFSSPKKRGARGCISVDAVQPRDKSTSNQREYSQRNDKCNFPRGILHLTGNMTGKNWKTTTKQQQLFQYILGGKQRINRPDIAHQIYNICTYIWADSLPYTYAVLAGLYLEACCYIFYFYLGHVKSNSFSHFWKKLQKVFLCVTAIVMQKITFSSIIRF